MEENLEEEGYFALLSNRNNEFPEESRVTNKSVINYLIKEVHINV
jgi:dTDP-4-dehydrorhamnose reductase